MKICNVDGCNNKVYAKGLCVRHYNQIRCSGKILKRFRNDKNEYEIYSSKVLISIYNKKSEIIEKAIIDKDDIEKVSKYKWHVLSNGYIATTLKNRKLLLLHRYITNCPEGKVVDHINHDRSDNRKINLRICTTKENAQNRKDKPKGITKIKKRDKEYFVLQLHGRYIGCFKELQKAKDKREEILNKEL